MSGYSLGCMSEMALQLDELENFQTLKRRGPNESFWHRHRLRKSARVALNGTEVQTNIAVVLRQIRDTVNANKGILEAPDPTEGSNPRAEIIIGALGASACLSPAELPESSLH